MPAGPVPAMASNAVLSLDTSTKTIQATGGLAFVSPGIPYGYSLFITNTPVGGDVNEVSILAIDNSSGTDSVISYVDSIFSAPIATWTKVTLQSPPWWFAPITEIRVLLMTSANASMNSTTGTYTNLHAGTTMSVDNIGFAAPNSLSETTQTSSRALIYPTVFHDRLQVILPEQMTPGCRFTLFSAQGQPVFQTDLQKNNQRFTLPDLAAGPYFYIIRHDEENLQQGSLLKQ